MNNDAYLNKKVELRNLQIKYNISVKRKIIRND